MKRIAASVGSLLVLLALVPGGAIALLRWGRLDLATTIRWSSIFSVPDDGSLVLLALSVVGWLAWLMLTGSVVCEVLAALSHGRIRVRLPGNRVFGPAAAVLVASIAGLVATAPTGPGVDCATPGVVRIQTATGANGSGFTIAPDVEGDQHRQIVGGTDQFGGLARSGGLPQPGGAGDSGGPRTPGGLVPPGDPGQRDTATHAQVATHGERESGWHTIAAGEDLWSLAEHYYGQGDAWRVIVEANATLGLNATDALPVGTMIEIPALADGLDDAPSQALGEQLGSGTVTVTEGDTMWGLAQEHLGDGNRWPQLAEANAENVPDPHVIHPGDQLNLPDEAAVPGPAAPVDAVPGSGAGAHGVQVPGVQVPGGDASSVWTPAPPTEAPAEVPASEGGNPGLGVVPAQSAQGNKHQGNRHQSNQFQGNRHQRILRQLFRGRQRCRPRSRERPPLRHRPRCLLPSQMMCATTCSRWWVRWVWVRRLQWWARSCGGVIVSSKAGRWGAAGGGARTRHARPIRP